MGWMSTVIVLHDRLNEIENDPGFGKKLVNAIMSHSLRHGQGVDVSPGGAARVVEAHHADTTTLVAVGGNDAEKYIETFGWNLTAPEFKKRLLDEFADSLGYRVVKKSKPKGYRDAKTG